MVILVSIASKSTEKKKSDVPEIFKQTQKPTHLNVQKKWLTMKIEVTDVLTNTALQYSSNSIQTHSLYLASLCSYVFNEVSFMLEPFVSRNISVNLIHYSKNQFEIILTQP